MKKIRPIESIPGMGERKVKANDGEGEFNHDICKNIYKCHNVSPVEQ
jgi:hypothetical protein